MSRGPPLSRDGVCVQGWDGRSSGADVVSSSGLLLGYQGVRQVDEGRGRVGPE